MIRKRELDSVEKSVLEEKEVLKTAAEFGMWGYDFIRYHELLKKADVLNEMVLNKDVTAIKPFFSVLKVLYNNFYPLFFDKARMRKLLKKIEKLIEDWDKKCADEGRILFPETLARELDRFYRVLLVRKQWAGLGVPVEKIESDFRKLKRAAGLAE